MDPAKSIEQFLDQVLKHRSRVNLLKFLLTGLLVLVSAAFSASLISYFFPDFHEWLMPFLILWAFPLGWVWFRFFLQPHFTPFTRDHAALLVEEKIGGMQNSLINSIQLKPALEGQNVYGRVTSVPFIRELLSRTSKQIADISPQQVIEKKSLRKYRNLLAGVTTAFVITVVTVPGFLGKALMGLTPPDPARQTQLAEGPGPAPTPSVPDAEFSIDRLDLVFNFPSYARMEPLSIEGATGDIEVLPGTEVKIRAQTGQAVTGGELVLNQRDYLNMETQGERVLEGSFIAREKGFYQFQLKSEKGKALLADKHNITLTRDMAPVILLFPKVPKPIYYPTDTIQMSFETRDDFGIQRVDLIVDIDGEIKRHTVKNVKTVETEMKGTHTWELSPLDLKPGAEVHYYLEAIDNDNIFGPNTGQSEAFSFQVFDEFQKREDLLALQDELIERMIGLLAHSLVIRPAQWTGSPEGLQHLKRKFTESSDQLVEIITLAQSILIQAKRIESFPKPYIIFLNNMVTGFNEIRGEQIQALNGLNSEIGRVTPIAMSFPPVEPVNDKLISQLERDILFMVKILNRERMNQAENLDRSLDSLTDTLRKEFENLKDKNSPEAKAKFQKALEKIKETLQKIMEQLAKQVQGSSEEFLNPKAFEQMDMDAVTTSMDKLQELVKQGKMDEAMSELESMMDNLQLLSNQIDQLQANQEEMVDMENMRKLEESMGGVERLEKKQKELLKQTTDLSKDLNNKQAERFEDRLADLFTALRKDVNAIQSILRQSREFLEDNPSIRDVEKLMDEEAEIRRQIQDLNQQTIDSLEQGESRDKFANLNQARNRLSDVMSRIRALHLKVFQGFKTYIPQMKDKYDKLEEFTELQDLNEFELLFKNTYPDVLRWQNHFRTGREVRQDLNQRMSSDINEVARLNVEISKKLGTLLRDLKKDFQQQIGKEEKDSLDKMAQKQDQLQKESEEITKTLRKMAQQNPMIPPSLGNKMSGGSQHMKMSKNNLSKHRVPESITSENRALKELSEVKEMLKEMQDTDNQGPGQSKRKMVRLGSGRARENARGGGSVRMQKERVTLPGEDQYKVPGQFREEILKAMKRNSPEKYQRMVSEYYKELVK